MKIDLKKYNEKPVNNIKPVFAKRYSKNGEEYLKKIDEINIEEDLKEKKLQIERLFELLNTQERLKDEELLNELTLDELKEIENLTILNDIDTYEFLNKTNELKEFYNKMPEDIRKEYNNISRFGKEYLPQFIKEQTERIKEQELKIAEQDKSKNIYNGIDISKLQEQLLNLQNQVSSQSLNTEKGEKENV